MSYRYEHTVIDGKTWQDMPGKTSAEKKISFSVFARRKQFRPSPHDKYKIFHLRMGESQSGKPNEADGKKQNTEQAPTSFNPQ